MDSVYNFKREIKNGVTKPVLISTENDKHYIIKFIHDDCNSKILFNELVSYRLACLLNIPVPECKLLKLSQDFIDRNQYLIDLNAKPCICFASEYIKGMSAVTPVLLANSLNIADIPKIILFDQLIMNEDRSTNPGNILYSVKEKKLIAIDHSHVFRNGMIWSYGEVSLMADDSPIVIKNLDGDLYKYFSKYVNGHSPFHFIKGTIESISDEQIETVFQDIPAEWNITGLEIQSVKRLIVNQMKNLDGIMHLMKDNFCDWKGVI